MKYGIISDVHGNLEALNVVLKELQGVDQFISLGDIVGYGPDPNECVEKVRTLNIVLVAGNHDKAVTGEMEMSWFAGVAKEAVLWTQKQLTKDNLAYLKKLPQTLDIENFSLVHGSLRRPLEEYVTSIFDAMPTFELMQKPLLFVGHSHMPLAISQDKEGKVDGGMLADKAEVKLDQAKFPKVIINVGGVGQPRDGDPRASYGIYDTEEKKVTIHRVTYNIKAVQEKMRKAGLPDSLAARLSFGR